MTATPVCVFAKPPLPGKVKTRLAQSIGEVPAAALASAMLRDVWGVVSSVPGAIPILAAAEEGEFPIEVTQENFWLQGGGGLGCRIRNILMRGLSESPSAIALGADSPLLTPEHVKQALAYLALDDAVIGPSFDGGFYLLGLRKFPVGLLEDVRWSTTETRHGTLEGLSACCMSVSELSSLGDVDTIQDLRILYQELKVLSPEIAPATRQWFIGRDFT